MGQWQGSNGLYAPPPLRQVPQDYPSGSNFLGGKWGNTAAPPSKEPEYVVKEREIAAANIWLLVPALIGAGASFLLLLMTDGIKAPSEEDSPNSESCSEPRDTRKGTATIVLYSGIVTAGVAIYVFDVMTATDGHPITAFVPVAAAIGSLILYFAAAYALEYHLVPGSFKGEEIGDNPVMELLSFTYFSITTFATAAMGDIAPLSRGARILVSMEVLFFVFIFTMGIVFFSQP